MIPRLGCVCAWDATLSEADHRNWCDQARLVEGEWSLRCLHETSLVVQRVCWLRGAVQRSVVPVGESPAVADLGMPPDSTAILAG